MIEFLLGEEKHFLEPRYFELRKKDYFLLTNKNRVSSYNFPVEQGCFLIFSNLLKMFGLICLDENDSIYDQCHADRDEWLEVNGFILFDDEIKINISEIQCNRTDHVKGKVRDFLNNIYFILPGQTLSTLEIKITKKSEKSTQLEKRSFNDNQDIINAQNEFKARVSFYYDRLKIFFPKLSLTELESNCKELVKTVDFNMVQFKTFEAKRYFFIQLATNSTLYSWDWILKHSVKFDEKVQQFIEKID